MTRVVVLDDYQRVAAAYADWSSLPATVDFVHEHLGGEDSVAARLAGYDVVVAMRERTPFPASLLARLDGLRLLVTTGPRNRSIDVAAAAARGITVCGTRSLDYPAAELTWALILGLARDVANEHARMRAGRWQEHVGTGLHGKRLGVVGLGKLGTQVARIGGAFGMDVVAWSENLTDDRAAAAGATRVGKDELFESSDFVTLHLVLSDRTRGVVGGRELEGMRRTAYLVNTSRGPLVDTGALVAVLRDRRITGAALDVYDVEPLPPDHVLRTLDNLLLTPHVGYVVDEGYRLFFTDVVEDIAAWLAGSPVRVLRP